MASFINMFTLLPGPMFHALIWLVIQDLLCRKKIRQHSLSPFTNLSFY
jgi:hypothetical protein